MFSNYLKTAFRSLWRNKRYAILNITGLTLGIMVCLVIYLVIRYETSFDDFHANKDRIFRVLTVTKGEDGTIRRTQAVPFAVPVALPPDIAAFETVARTVHMGKRLVTVSDDKGNIVKKMKPAVFFLPPDFFRMFDYKWLAGDRKTAMNDPNNVLLTRSTAEKYFGTWQQAMGKTVKLDRHFQQTVTGILEDAPRNTEFGFDMVVPISQMHLDDNTDWTSLDDVHHTYVMLRPGQTMEQANRQLAAFADKYRKIKSDYGYTLQPLSGVHSDPETGNFHGRVTSAERIRMFWMIGGFILLIACVNFINLSTAQAVNRAREIGVRKVLGSQRWQLKLQFLAETGMLVLCSIILATVASAGVLPFISSIMDLPLHAGMLLQYNVWALLIAVLLVVTFLAGFYPSIVVSAFNPVAALRSRIAASAQRSGGISLRRSLVVFQFIIAQALIIGTLLILQQMNYFHKQSMGFTQDAIVNIPFWNDSIGNARRPYITDQLKQIAGVEQVSFSSTAPSTTDNWWTPFKYNHQAEDTKFASVSRWVDDNFLHTYNMKLIAGRNVTATDSVREMLVNETLVKKLGLQPEDVLNKHFDIWGRINGNIVGVVQDFSAASLKEAIAPVFMVNLKNRFNSVSIRMAAGTDIKKSLASVERIWAANFPEMIFEYSFLDEKIAEYYKEETKLARLYEIFAGIAIFLSCLGLYGLASFMAVQRLKEVGVRKVLGATSSHIVYLFSKEFVVLIAIAFVIASPLVWYFMHNWLNNFVHRIEINWSVFVLGGLAAVVIALITVSSQAIRAAMTNPVNSLKAD